MHIIDRRQSIAEERLRLKEDVFALGTIVVARVCLRGSLVLVVGMLASAYLLSIGLDHILIYFGVVAVSAVVGLREVWMDFQLHNVEPVVSELLGTQMQEYLEDKGWWVRVNNQHYFYATKSRGLAQDHFYIIYSGCAAYVRPVYEVPFPFSSHCAKRDMDFVRRSAGGSAS